MPEPRAVTSERSISMESSTIPVASALPARTRRVAALLAIVWTLPALLCASHTLTHALDHDPHEFVAVDEQLTSRTNEVDHHHEHGHPESDPLVTPERTKELDAPLLESASPRVPPTHASPQWRAKSEPGHAVGLALAVSGPRAPPIS